MTRVLPLLLAVMTVTAAACRRADGTRDPVADHESSQAALWSSWAKGTGHRVDLGERLQARLLTLATDGSTVKIGACVEDATSFVPSPRDGRVFFVIRGQVAVGQLDSQASPAPLTWTLSGTAPMVSSLLAIRAIDGGVELLVDTPGVDGSGMLLRVSDAGAIVAAASAAGDPALATRDAFLAAFSGTRCQDGGRECLLYSSYQGRTALDLEPSPDAGARPLIEIREEVLEATWRPDRRGEILALVKCASP